TVGGFTVRICSSGKEALESVRDFDPDLVLLDVMMPGMDGPTTLKAMKSTEGLTELPIIFVTAKVQPQEIAEYRKMGAIDVIPKPFDPMSLANSIRKVWAQCAL
ncbi:MAG: response regulator, partial [Proteobacteria bacterium]|nr:response regulator [Pseudomonadota bacterium]